MAKFIKILISPSALALILANVTPLFGFLFWSWDLFSIIILYWLETAVIGFFNILKIQKLEKKSFSAWLAFFMLQYTFFLLAYLFLIVNIFKPDLGSATEYIEALKIVFQYLYTLLIATLFMFISHGISYQYNFIDKKEFLDTSTTTQIFVPYKRMLIIHIIVILAGKGISYYDLSQELSIIVFLVILKLIFDLIFHFLEHNKKNKA